MEQKEDTELKFKEKGDLTQGLVKDHLIRLSVPMIWGILAIISFQLVDMYFISMLGEEQLTAISFTFPVTHLIFSFVMGFGIATSSVVSRLIGAGSMEDVKRVATHALIIVFVLAFLISSLGLVFHDGIFSAMGADEPTLAMISDYMHIWFAGAIFLSVPMVANSAMRAGGDSRVPATIMATVAIVNLVLDPLLIFGLLGFPRLELQGAAIATVFANACAMVSGLYVLCLRKKMVCSVKNMQFADFGNSIKRILSIALPAGITQAIQPLVNGVIIALLATHTADAVAAYGVVSRVEAFAFVILMALAVGMGPVIGQNWGMKKFDRVNEALKLSMRFNIGWSILVAAVLAVHARLIADIFTNDEAVIGYAILFFWVVPITYAFSNLINGWASAFNAMGMPQRSFAMIVGKMVVVMVPAIYIGNEFGGILGIFIAIAVSNLAAGIAIHIWSWQQCKKREQAA